MARIVPGIRKSRRYRLVERFYPELEAVCEERYQELAPIDFGTLPRWSAQGLSCTGIVG